MGTKQQTTASSTSQQNLNFDPASKGQYDNFWSLASPILNSMITNPYGSPSFALNLAQGQQYASQAGRNNIQNALSNFQTSGMGQPAGGVKASLMSSLGRYGSSLGSQAFYNAANGAQSNMWNALSMQGSRTPLVTGQTGSGTSNSTTSTSGLGTWLPQVAGMALGAATGGLGGALGGLMKGGGQTASQNPLSQVGGSLTNFMPPSASGNSYFNPQAPNITQQFPQNNPLAQLYF